MSIFEQRPYRLGANRRDILKGGLALSAGALLQGTLVGRTAAQGAGLVFWDYKSPPGSAGDQYYQAAAKRFKAQSGIDVAIEFKSAEGIEQAVAAAANAGQGFDSLCWWSGPTARNQASLGNVIALDGKLPADVIAAKAGLDALRWNGKLYAAPRTIGTYFLIYNRELLRKAGVDPAIFPAPNAEPISWADFISVCDKVKASGVAPLMFANKEGYFNEWYVFNFEGQSFDTVDEIAAINTGGSTWKNQAVYDALGAYRELYERKFFVEGGDVVAYEQHVRQMGGGQCAMSVYFDQSDGASAAIIESFGKENLGFSRPPAYRSDKKLYGHSPLEPDAVYVASFSEKQEEAIKWVSFLMGLDEVNELVKALQLAPADGRFDTSLITDPELAKLYQGAAQKGYVYPYTFTNQTTYNAILQNTGLFLSGGMTAEQLCDLLDKADQEQKAQQP